MDDAIWHRIIVIPFPVTIPAEERDKDPSTRLAGELSRIFHWAMDGLSEWKQQGLNEPPRVLQSTGNYREDNDTVGQCIKAACIVEHTCLTSMKELFESYKSWCENSGTDAMSNSCFGKELTRRKFEQVKGRSGNSRRGIGIKPTAGADLLKVA
jgi:putative DNA primase/helicase